MVLLGSMYGLSSNLVTSLIQLMVLGLGAYFILNDQVLGGRAVLVYGPARLRDEPRGVVLGLAADAATGGWLDGSA